MGDACNAPCPQDDLDNDNRWMNIHERYCGEVKNTEPDVLFIGDSHIALLEQSDFYRDVFAPLHCLCFGIRGDTTANVHWRLQNGELEYIKPKVIIVLIGTNNRGQTVDQVLAGIRSVVDLIADKQKQASIFVLKIPPRGQKPNPKRDLIASVNAQLQQTLSHLSNCHVIDIDPGFVGPDGSISHRDMYDYLHLTNQGYKKAFEIVHLAIQSVLSPDQ